MPSRPPISSSDFAPEAEATRHDDWCDAYAAESLRNLERTYGRDIKSSLIELSSSIVVRSEHSFNIDERRLSLRKHIYELDASARAGTEPALSFRPIDAKDRFGRYLGFVDLRAVWQATPLALGLLAIPKRYLHDPATRLIVGSFGPLFGGPSFPASVYSMHDPGASGAYCAQASIIMALGMLADRGGRLDGSHTLTFQGREKIPNEAPRALPPDCVVNHPTVPPGSHYIVGGLDPDQCLAVLRDSTYRVSAAMVSHTDRAQLPDRLTKLIVQAYINARFPVILGVDAYLWYAKEIPNGRLKDETLTLGSDAHAVVVVGYRATGPGRDDVALIVHDPSDRPFAQRRLSACLDAGWGYTKKVPSDPGRLVLLPVADERVRVHLHECIEWLRSPAARSFFRRRVGWAQSTGSPDLLKHRQELQHLSETFERYVSPRAGTEDQYDLRIGLIDPSACDVFFQHVGDRHHVRDLSLQISRLPGRRYWCLAGYVTAPSPIGSPQHALRPASSHLRHVWVFDVENRGDPSPYTGQPRRERWLALALGIGSEVTTLYGPPGLSFQIPTPLDAPPTPIPAASAVRLSPAVMTSCSTRRLRDFVAEVASVGQNHKFDVFLLREDDLNDFLLSRDPGYTRPPSQDRRTTDTPNPVTPFLAAATLGDCEDFARWIAEQFSASRRERDGHPIAAIATYLPGVTSLSESSRREAVLALAHCVQIGLNLQHAGLMREVVVELVCGSILDRCLCPVCKPVNRGAPPRCHVNARDGKIALLLQSLEEVVGEVGALSGENRPRFSLGVELEPGATYVLNGIDAIRRLIAGVTGNSRLSDHVGLNLDIAHMRIAGIAAHELTEFIPRIVHAHIADHPAGMHTRDQPPGSWTPVYTTDSPYIPFMRLLAQRSRGYTPGQGLPFSGAFALELEGCDRIDWVYQSIPAMRHLADVAANWA